MDELDVTWCDIDRVVTPKGCSLPVSLHFGILPGVGRNGRVVGSNADIRKVRWEDYLFTP
jgi:hypothetical protein